MPTVRANGIDIAYESFGEGEPILLIMGIGGQMVLWDEHFCRDLAARGFRVIRYDNRDVGASTKLDALPTPSPREVFRRRLLGRPIGAGYTLDDMADDAAGLLDALDLPWAHVVGMSLGGMIAQCMALRHPERARTLALIMSNSGDLWANWPKRAAFRALVANVGNTREAAIARQLHLFRVLSHPTHRTPEERVMEIAGIHYDRGVYPRGFARQFAAMMASKPRLRALSRVRAPTMVIHGAHDPLVHPLGGRLLAAAIPGARLSLIHELGHDFAPSVWPHVIDALVANTRRMPRANTRRLWQLRQLAALVARPISID